VFTQSDAFTASAGFTASKSFAGVAVVPGVGDQIASGLLSSGAIGAGAAGLAALAALLVLLLLLKKKKEPDLGPAETEIETTATLDDVNDYISEYGMSDGVPAIDDDENLDMPCESGSNGDYASDVMNASENNPDDLEGFEGDADES
jgi:hypothetical protein